MKNTIFVIDGSAIIYRSYFAFKNRPLINSRGENTSAIFGFLRTIISLLEHFEPEYFAITFDEREPTFRHKTFKEYKATRDKMPEDLVEQLEPILEMVSATGIAKLSKPGYEADDIIGTLAKRYENKHDLVIVSSDKDLCQLVDDHVKIYDQSKDLFIGIQEVEEKFDVPPDKIIDLLSLTGDSSDNVPGIPKVGPKTAAKLIHEFGDLENILSHAQEITSDKIKDSIIEFADQGRLSKELVTLDMNVPIDLNLTALKTPDIFTEDLKIFCTQYEMFAFMKYFDGETEQPKKKEFKYSIIDNQKEFSELIQHLDNSTYIAVDLETDSCDPINDNIVGISFCVDDERSYYIPLGHVFGKQLDKQLILQELKPILQDPSKKYIGHNIKFDYMIFQNEGIELANLYFDTMIASYVLAPEEHRHNLNEVSMKYLQHSMIPITDIIGKGRNQIQFGEAEIEKAAEYAAEDAYITFLLWEKLNPQIDKISLSQLFYDIEMPLVKTLAQLERNGIYIDLHLFKKLSLDLDKKTEELKDTIYYKTGEEFNIDSPAQLSEILFEKMDLPVIKKTKTGYSTDIEVLTKLSKTYEIAADIIDYRQLKKLQSTYINAFPKLINPHTHRIHSSFNQTVTATGRLSSSNPNLQNIPIRTEIGREMRKGFIAQKEDHVILSADYSQIELRIVALLSKDERMIENFKKDGDIHSQTAATIFGIDEKDVTPDQRRQAKVINFGIIYGMGAFSLSEDLGLSRTEAQAFIDNYFSFYKGVYSYLESTKKFAHDKGYVKTIFNRRRYLPGINSRNRNVQSNEERMAINMPIQGTAADMIKIAMNDIYNNISHKTDEIMMIIQVHDELVFEIQKSKIDLYKKLIKQKMENVLPGEYAGIVPIKVDIGFGKSWYDAH
ncbi:MAG: DNA polymerase I [Candidatus Cloacimonetes bacterium]|nr:DNA polymerase I [Candidatus Cloacimonadota bacterium]